MEENKSLDLKALLELVLLNWKVILLTMSLGAAISIAYTYFLVIPQYSASVTIYVNNTKMAGVDKTYMADLQASQHLVETYITIIKSNAVLSQVAAAGDDKYTADQIRNMISAQAIGQTEVFEVTVRNSHPQHAAKIANLIATVAPDEIANFVEASSVKVIDYAKTNRVPISPNYMTNTLLGVLIGLVAGFGFLLLRDLLDVRIKSPQELEMMFAFPLLGVIPEIDTRDTGEANDTKKKSQQSQDDLQGEDTDV